MGKGVRRGSSNDRSYSYMPLLIFLMVSYPAYANMAQRKFQVMEVGRELNLVVFHRFDFAPNNGICFAGPQVLLHHGGEEVMDLRFSG